MLILAEKLVKLKVVKIMKEFEFCNLNDFMSIQMSCNFFYKLNTFISYTANLLKRVKIGSKYFNQVKLRSS